MQRGLDRLDAVFKCLMVDEDEPRRSIHGAHELQASAAHIINQLAQSQTGLAQLQKATVTLSATVLVAAVAAAAMAAVVATMGRWRHVGAARTAEAACAAQGRRLCRPTTEGCAGCHHNNDTAAAASSSSSSSYRRRR